MAAYRPAAIALGATLVAGAVSNALLSTLTSWTAERFAARLKARLFTKIVSSDQASAAAHRKSLHSVCVHWPPCNLSRQLALPSLAISNCPYCPFVPDGCCIPFAA